MPLDKANGLVWVRVFWNANTCEVFDYSLFANINGVSQLVSEIVGKEECLKGTSISDLPTALANPVHAMLVRRRSLDGAFWVDDKTLWLYDVQFSKQDLLDITGRDRWQFEKHGKRLLAEIMEAIESQMSTEDSG